MIYVLIYIIDYILGVGYTIIIPDRKTPDWRDRISIGLILGIIWPIMVLAMIGILLYDKFIGDKK
jgi:hypothetical protein